MMYLIKQIILKTCNVVVIPRSVQVCGKDSTLNKCDAANICEV